MAKELDLGNKLRNRRLELKMTLSDLSQLSGLAPQLISDYENERKEPGLKNFVKLCEALKVGSAYFLEEDPFGINKKSTYGYALRMYLEGLKTCKSDKLVVSKDKVVIEINTKELIGLFRNIDYGKQFNDEILSRAITNMAINMGSTQEIEEDQ